MMGGTGTSGQYNTPPNRLLLSGLIATAAGTLGGGGIAGFTQNLVQVGAPAVVGGVVYSAVTWKNNASADPEANYLQAIAIAGGSAVALLTVAGAYEFQFDAGSLLFIILLGGSLVVSETILKAL